MSHDAGCQLKGGHLAGADDLAVDIYASESGVIEVSAPLIGTANTHGTGCSLSSALAALRPQRDSWETTVRDAKARLTEALRHADELQLGHGHGPVHHFHAWWGAS